MKNKKLYIFGGESTAIEIYETALLLNKFEEIIFVVADDLNPKDSRYINESFLSSSLVDSSENYFIVSMTNYEIKNKCIAFANKLNLSSLSIIHPSSNISSFAKIGKGTYIAANSIVSFNVIIGNNCIINFNTVIGHDSLINDFCSINPGAVLGGHVILGKNVLIGANSFIKQGLSISENSQVDALTYIFRNIDEPSICTSRNLKVYKK